MGRDYIMRVTCVDSPMGMTRVQYSRADRLWLLTSPSTRTAMKPTAEQKAMCHSVRVMGKGKSLYASTHCRAEHCIGEKEGALSALAQGMGLAKRD